MYENRESKNFYYIHHQEVCHVTGYSCAPNNPDVWWIPSVGYSVPESRLYETEVMAYSELQKQLLEERRKIEMRLQASRIVKDLRDEKS